MNILTLFRQKYDLLSNGDRVQEGDTVSFINSDGEKCTDKIRRSADTGRLYFWNTSFKITDYKSAFKS